MQHKLRQHTIHLYKKVSYLNKGLVFGREHEREDSRNRLKIKETLMEVSCLWRL